MVSRSYRYQAELLVKDYLLHDSFIPYTSLLGGICFCKMVIQMHTFGYLLVFVVPSALGIMNLMWFGKILKGVRKTLSKGR